MPSPDLVDGFALKNRPGQCPVPFYQSVAAPTFPARLGSLCVDTVGAKLYICTVITGTWVSVGSQT